MSQNLTVTPETTVAEVADSGRLVRAALIERGIDLCCGGSLTLREAAEVRGVDLEELVGALRQAAGAGAPAVPPRARAAAPACATPAIRSADSVRAVLARHPHLAGVFERHGLLGCGGPAGPDEPIGFFAAMHRVDEAALLAELNAAAACGAPAGAESAAAPAADTTSTLHRRFLAAGIAAALTLGASFGAYNLLAIHLALGPVPPAHNWLHAGFQVMGFVLFFIMGVAYHAVPRFLRTALARPGLARATFGLAVAGLLLRSYGLFDGLLPGTLPALAAGSLVQLAAVAGFAAVLAGTWRRARPAPELFQRFLASGTLGWLAAAGFGAAGGVAAWRAGSAAEVARWNEPLYLAALFGGALPWIQGMFLRTGPVFLGLRAPRPALVRAAFVLGAAGAVLATGGAAASGWPGGRFLLDLGLLAVSASSVVFALGTQVFAPGTGHSAPAGPDRGFPRIVRLAFAASFLFAALASAHALLDLAGRDPSRLLYDGGRHAFALGFVTLMIFGMASRIVPIFGGVELRWPGLRTAGACLIGVGLLLREAEAGAALLGAPGLMRVSGPSGIVAALGVWLASLSILATLRAAARTRAAADPGAAAATVPITADTNVAALVAAHAEALPILIAAGFTPLANPVLRRTMARAVSLRQACAMHHLDVEAILDAIRAACPHAPGAPSGDARAPVRFRAPRPAPRS